MFSPAKAGWVSTANSARTNQRAAAIRNPLNNYFALKLLKPRPRRKVGANHQVRLNYTVTAAGSFPPKTHITQNYTVCQR